MLITCLLFCSPIIISENKFTVALIQRLADVEEEVNHLKQQLADRTKACLSLEGQNMYFLSAHV